LVGNQKERGLDVTDKRFDLQVTHRDNKTGKVIRNNPYIARVIKAEDGGKTTVFERPAGSGNLWDKKDAPVGRWENGSWKKEATHVEFQVPETQDDKLKRSLIEKDVKLAAALKELEAIKAERAAGEKEVKAAAKPKV
jgi:hypothetical protein